MRCEAPANVPLLVGRPQDVGIDPNDLGRLQLQRFECRWQVRVAFGEVVQIHGLG